MVVQVEATSTNANTGEMLKSVCWKSKDSVECLAVLSDWICSFEAINDGISEQYCSKYRRKGRMEKIVGKESVL